MMKKAMCFMASLAIGIALGCVSCSKDDDIITTPINEGNDPNFKIVANTNTNFSAFNRKVTVFDISIYAVAAVEDNKLLHAANVMAQYLDNNEDGTVDNQDVWNAMKSNNASLVMWKTENDLNNLSEPSGAIVQDLGADETQPNFVPSGTTGQFDASLEEVWHLITNAGYAFAYPTIFGENAGTSLTNAMDIARGGNFTTIPNPYPAGAWYTYDDTTCDYSCMAAEYIYWGMSSILGAQKNRLNEIQQEWKLNTKTLVETTDTAIYGLLTNAQYKFPTILPDGTYKR